jgi:peptidyl-prolyl cis-trans isomerase C
VKLRMIVIAKGDTPEETTAQRAKLERVKAALAKGDEFAAVAVAHSEDSRAAEGGDRGWLERDMLREDLAEVAFACAIGAVSETVDIGKQVCILTVEDKVDSVIVSFEDVQGRIEHELKIGQSRQLFTTWIARLRKHAYIKIVDEALAP